MFARLILILILSIFGGATFAQSLEIETAQGTALVPQSPKTVVALDVAAVDTLDALGVPVAGTLGSLYVNYLDHVEDSAVDLGTFWEPDVEAIHALDPDLIIVGTRSADQRASLGRIAPAIDMTVGEDVLAEALARLVAFGVIFDRQQEAEDLEAALNAKLLAAREAVAGKGTGLIVMTNGPKISAYGRGGRFGWLHSAVGLPEAKPEIGASVHGEVISFEFIKEADPDWLVVVDRLAAIGQPGEGAAATLDNAIVRDTRAWRSGQVIYLDAADIYIAGGGIQSMMRTLDELIAGFGKS